MSNKVTVRAELEDGTVVQFERSWLAGNPSFIGFEAEAAARNAAASVRDALDGTYKGAKKA